MFHKFLISYGNKNIKYNPKVMNQWGFLTQYQINKLDHKKEKGISDKLNEKYFFDKKWSKKMRNKILYRSVVLMSQIDRKSYQL